MGYFEKIEDDLKGAIKDKDDVLLRTLRMLKSDIMYEKTKGSSGLSEDSILEIILRASKKRKEAIGEYTKAAREDLAEKEREELLIIERYLPKQLSEEEVFHYIEEKIRDMGEISKKDFGKIMGQIMKELKGQADGGMVKALLTKKLENL